MQRFFNPKTIAVIGASRTPGKLGYELVKNLKRYRGGKVYEVNPNMKYKSITDIKDKIDLVAIIVKAEMVPQIVDECGIKGVKNIIIFTGGFKEAGHPDLQNKIVEYAAKYNMKIIGPNVNGIYDAHSGLDCMYMIPERLSRPKAGSISLISQSGTIGIWFLEWAYKNNFGVSKYISYGNRCVVKEYELINYLNNDPNTKIIALYMEGGIDGEEIYKAISRCNKPIIIFRCGQTWKERGNNAVFNHIGCNLGRYQTDVTNSCHNLGAIMVNSIEQFFAAIKALMMQPKSKGKIVNMITNGAGPLVQILNMSEPIGLGALDLQLKDLVGSATVYDYEYDIRHLVNSDLCVVYINWETSWSSIEEKLLIKEILGARQPLICMMYDKPYSKKFIKELENGGVPVFNTPQEVAAAMVALCSSR